MSKLSSEVLTEAIESVLKLSKTKKRNFTETIELQIALKNYDPQKDKRFSGVVRLPTVARPKLTVAILANAKDVETAQKCNVPSHTVEDLKKLNKNKKLVKKLAGQYNAFLASSSLIRMIPRILGPGLNKAGKFPGVFNPTDDLPSKVDDIKASVKFQLKSKKTTCMGVPVANVEMTPEDIEANITMAVNFMVSLLPKNWLQVKKLYIKSTMGPSHKIFGF
jgi:large subunit ribosomal protein L10Ae